MLSNKEPHQFYGMQTIEEFNGNSKISLAQFWGAAGPMVAVILLLTVIIITWPRPSTVECRASIRKKLGLFSKKKTSDPKEQRPMMAEFGPHLGKRFPWFLRKKVIDPETPSP